MIKSHALFPIILLFVFSKYVVGLEWLTLEHPVSEVAPFGTENNLISSFPYTQDFEGFLPCGNNFDTCNFDCAFAIANGWVQDSGDGDDWRIDFGTTSSGNTGPDQDHNPGTSTGKYVYTEASGCQSVTSILTSPCFDITHLINPYVDFYVHMYGADMGTMSLECSEDGGNSWTELWSKTGQLQTSGSDPWSLQEVSLGSAGDTIQLRWIGLTGPAFTSDMALDDIVIYRRKQFDVAITAIDSLESRCQLSDMELVSITLMNLGSDTLYTIPVEVEVNGGGFMSAGTYMGEILPDETDTFNFFLDLSVIDVYNIEVLAVLSLDEDPSNDTISISVEHITPVVIFPYNEDFESFAPCGNNFDPCGFDCMVATANGWIQDAGDGDDWRIGFGTTGSGGTGPDQDHNPGTPTGQYLFTEASGCQGVTSILNSPCFDLSNLGDPYVDFYVHMFGTDMGTMSLQITMDGGHTWMELWSTTGQLQTAGDEPWALQEVSLSQPPGIIQLRWIGLTGPGFASDMALDDVRIYDRQYATCFLDSIFVDNTLLDVPIDLYRASTYIESNALIESGRNIVFKAGTEINFLYPFTIELGAAHCAQIESCTHESKTDVRE